MNAKEFAETLRAVAAWYDAHPDVPTPGAPVTFNAFLAKKDDMVALARTLRPVEKHHIDNWFFLRVPINDDAWLDFNIQRTEVCTPRVVGQRVVSAQEATPERVEDVIEWECHALLAEDS